MRAALLLVDLMVAQALLSLHTDLPQVSSDLIKLLVIRGFGVLWRLELSTDLPAQVDLVILRVL